MVVPAMVVVDGEDVGVLFAQERCQPLRRFVDVGSGERAGGVVRRLAVHAGVVVAEELDAVDAEHRERPRAARRRGDRRSSRPTARIVGSCSPSSPRVATTSTTRCPSALARAIVPAVAIDSSSGCAWKVTSVSGTEHLAGFGAPCGGVSMTLASAFDCSKAPGGNHACANSCSRPCRRAPRGRLRQLRLEHEYHSRRSRRAAARRRRSTPRTSRRTCT